MKSFNLIETTSIHRRLEASGDLRAPVRNAYSALNAVRDALSEKAHLLVGLAHDRHPGLADDEALKRLADGWFGLASEIQKAGAATRQRCKEDSAGLARHVKAAGWRQIAIDAELCQLEAVAQQGSVVVIEKRKALIRAGATEADAMRIVPDVDQAAALAEVPRLKAEQAQIKQFFLTRDPDDLPADFEDTIQSYKIAQHVVDEPALETQAA